MTILRTGSGCVAFYSINSVVRTWKSMRQLVEAVTPQTIPQFWPPDSLDYRRELILVVAVGITNIVVDVGCKDIVDNVGYTVLTINVV